MSLSEDRKASYAKIIDAILGASDLDQISAKKVRTGLQAAVDHDISTEKQAINQLIGVRFDKFDAERKAPVASSEAPTPVAAPASAKPKTNGAHVNGKANHAHPPPSKSPKRSSTELSDVIDAPPKKKPKPSPATPGDADAALAARLQAEENSMARPTRGGGGRKRSQPIKKSPKKKSKSSNKIKADDDSALSSEEGDEKESKKGGAFNKPWLLSEPLAALVGETSLSRPQTVKRIWEYIKANDLQYPEDKRQIHCDDTMKAVFKQDNVHMFSMNKLLGKHLYPMEGED